MTVAWVKKKAQEWKKSIWIPDSLGCREIAGRKGRGPGLIQGWRAGMGKLGQDRPEVGEMRGSGGTRHTDRGVG